MLVRKQNNKIVLLEIQIDSEKQQCFSSKKQKNNNNNKKKNQIKIRIKIRNTEVLLNI